MLLIVFSVNKICIQSNAVIKIIVTENWIIKVTALKMYIAHQSDASLVVNQANTLNFPYQNDVQYINIEVRSSRANVETFVIRINALDFRDLQDHVARTIVILPNVAFHRTLLDQFIEAFKETTKNNPIYRTNQVILLIT